MAPRGIDTPVRGAARSQISFSSAARDVAGDHEDVQVLDPATGRARRVTNATTPEALEYCGGDWSPDRARLVAFGHSGPGGLCTYVIDAADGAERARVAWGDASPTWFDDTTLLVLEPLAMRLTGEVHRQVGEVFAVDVESCSVHQVTQLGGAWRVHSLSWHPVAGLALHIGPSDAAPWAGERTATVSAARVRRAVAGTGVAVRPRDLRYPFGDAPTQYPDWAPDGRRIAVVRLHSDAGAWTPTDIAVGNVVTGRLTVVVDGSGLADDGDGTTPSYYGQPAWSPDGRSIAWLAAYREDWSEIWVGAPDGSSSRQVTSFGHQEAIHYLDW